MWCTVYVCIIHVLFGTPKRNGFFVTGFINRIERITSQVLYIRSDTLCYELKLTSDKTPRVLKPEV